MEKQCTRNKHFVLVHGACHGAWSWYKLVTLLEKEGHKVTALDLLASGRQPFGIDKVQSFQHYVQPLIEVMSSLAHKEKVILVGHSLGGVAISLAMEAFPEKIAAAVYVAGIAPGIDFPASEFFNKFFVRNSAESLLDTQVSFDDGPDNPPTSLWFGPKLIASRMYQLCPHEVIIYIYMLNLQLINYI
ncbi:alpha/beta-Hydrolases protein [Dioscorea alata]|uniref:Alpha/beta-Hydrolases protein n=1 Tax=Dioscorea alata TaxID=55571 RepID=A0ACB7WAE1_DIOAL|nr:alpha/beta-Hydrolases protein [Dioscorea alata]